MGLSFRYLVAEDDRTVTRVARSQYHRWFSEGETLPANRVGRDLRLLEAAVEMDHHRVVDVLRILPEVPAVLARGAMTVNLAWWDVVGRQAVPGSSFMRPHRRLALILYSKDDTVPDPRRSC